MNLFTITKNENQFAAILVVLFLVITFFGYIPESNGQHVSHPLSVATTTASYYSYIYRTSDTTGIDIKYFLVKASNGDIKSAFNACEVCYGSYKGYSQITDKMRCNNCGNTYPIDGLGTQGPGGCWPGYLPHSETVDSIIITIANLYTGAYFFQTVPMSPPDTTSTAIPTYDLTTPIAVSMCSGQIIITMVTNAKKHISLVGIDGRTHYATRSTSTSLSINTKEMASGIYILSIMEEGKLYTRRLHIK